MPNDTQHLTPETDEQAAARVKRANPVISLSVQRRLRAQGVKGTVISELGSPTNPTPCTRCDLKEPHPPHDEKDDWHE